MQYCGCANIKGVILTKNMQKKWYVFWTEMQEKGCAFHQKIARERVSVSKKLQENGYGFEGRVGTPAYKN